jgi:RNA polymerase sigma-70 factor (ECF subfamily)
MSGPPRVDLPAQKQLGARLRAAYQDLVSEPVPEHLSDLVRRLEGADRLLAAVPSLRAFAISLSGSVDRADDLVQDTLLRALANIHRFEPGTNLNAWLFTILRNLFHSEYRKRKREVEDADGSYAARLATAPEQNARLDFDDLRLALAKLSPDQREAVLLIGAEGFSYEEAAQICGTAVGTIKSRVNRARRRLAELLLLEMDDIGPDRLTRAALFAA